MRDGRVDDLAEIVRRDVGRHADRDAAGAVDEQIRELRRHDRRLFAAAVVVFLILDGILVEIVENMLRDLLQTALGVAHGRGRIAVHRAEVALPVDERHAHREFLRQAHEGVVDRAVTVRVIVTHHLADHLGRLDVLLVPVEPELAHAVENAAMHGLQAVAHVGKRARHDHAHGVVEIAAPHLVGDHDRADVARVLAAAVTSLVLVSHVRSPAVGREWAHKTRSDPPNRMHATPNLR